MGKSSQLHFGQLAVRSERHRLAGDSSRLRNLGWRPQFGLRDGLSDALSGYFYDIVDRHET